MRIIVTGFGSFLSNETNPTEEIINKLPKTIEGNEIYTVLLPVVFDECFAVLKPEIDKVKPDVIILLGLAANRDAITPERVAINMKDSKGPDNNGYIPVDEIISKEGKDAYFSSLPIRDIVTNLTALGIPSKISNTAGLYVCNNIMYHVLEYIDHNELDIKAGFIHVPQKAKELSSKNGLSFAKIYDSIIEIIKTVF